MFIPGLVSISFRKESPSSVLAAAAAAGLRAIEWGGDVHVPPGDGETAARVGQMTRAAGLSVAAYGSYYHLGTTENPAAAFAPVLATAKALGAPLIRIWAGTSGSDNTSPARRDALAREARMLADMAQKQAITLSLECHGGTLTDRWESAVAFVQAVNHPALRLYWQPNQLYDAAYNCRAAEELAPYVTHLHVFHWDATHRYPLEMGRADWQNYLAVFQRAWQGDDAPHGLLLEFMHDDRLETLSPTAAELLSWIAEK